MNKQFSSKATSVIILLLIVIFFGCNSSNNSSENYSESIYAHKVDSLLKVMTLKEKIGQLNQIMVGDYLTGPGEKSEGNKERIELLKNGGVGSVLNFSGVEGATKIQQLVVDNSRLGIPLIFALDVIHGYKTMFPIPLAESASWDLEAIETSARESAKEAASAGIAWTFAPMVDISRDPRWGRVMEGAGEDPFLGSKVAEARVHGFQGKSLSDVHTIAACAKHFAAYGFVESGKDYNTVSVDNYKLHNVIFPPFKAAAEADVATFMNAYNELNGIPATANEYLVSNTLRGEWAYNGVVVSDWNSIGEMINHGTAKDKEQAAKQAFQAGCDIDMEAYAYSNHLEDLVENGEIEMAKIDQAVKRVLTLKYKLGLFDNPYLYLNKEREKQTLLNDSIMALSQDVAKKSIVLLKNKGNLLPLKAKNIAIIGPLAKDKDSPLGNWRAAAKEGSAVSFYDGLTNALDESFQISYAEGCKLSIGPNEFVYPVKIEENDRSGFEKAKTVASQAEVVFMVLGETTYMSGEARSRSDIGLPGLQEELLREVYKVNKNIILVLMNGRPLTLSWEKENIPAILETWHLGSKAGNAISEVIIGNYNPSGKLPMTFPRSVGQIPIYYNHKNTGRPSNADGMVFYTHHIDIENTPLFPFGFGLSYSTFKYANLLLDKEKIGMKDSVAISVTVANTSSVDGEEVVQLYIQDVGGSITRPVKELKDFKKLMIKAGDSRTVEFTLSVNDLSFYRKDMTFGAEPGKFNVYVGGNSEDVLVDDFELLEN